LEAICFQGQVWTSGFPGSCWQTVSGRTPFWVGFLLAGLLGIWDMSGYGGPGDFDMTAVANAGRSHCPLPFLTSCDAGALGFWPLGTKGSHFRTWLLELLMPTGLLWSSGTDGCQPLKRGHRRLEQILEDWLPWYFLP
jgi:hypothetical protein